jgi:aminocarboxymuconate-semialdehyde decarboxylase
LFDAIASQPASGVTVIEDGDSRHRIQFQGSAPTRPLPERLLDLDQRQDWMIQEGVNVQLLSTWADLFGYSLDAPQAVEWCRILNDTLMEAIADSPRFAAFASLPMQAPDYAVKMMEMARQRGFVGVTIATRIGSTELDHPTLAPFWDAASELAMTVFIHPGFDTGDPRTAAYGMVNAVGRGLETTIASTRLLFAGVPMRYPGARILLAHGGGALPMILGRLGRNHVLHPELSDPLVNFDSLLFDTVVFDTETLSFLVDKAGPKSVMLGSDYPFPIGDPQPLRVVRDTARLTAQERAWILGGNASQIFDLDEADHG